MGTQPPILFSTGLNHVQHRAGQGKRNTNRIGNGLRKPEALLGHKNISAGYAGHKGARYCAYHRIPPFFAFLARYMAAAHSVIIANV